MPDEAVRPVSAGEQVTSTPGVIARPYWIVSTHLGYQVVYGRFLTLEDAVQGATTREEKTGQRHEYVLVSYPNELAPETGPDIEYWATSSFDHHEIICGKYGTFAAAVREAKGCMKLTGDPHHVVVARVLRPRPADDGKVLE